LVWTVTLTVIPAVTLVGAVTTDCPGSTAPAPMVMPDEVVVVNEPELNASVLAPAEPVIARSVNVAVPVASVAMDVVPDSVPPPEAMVAVTDTPD